MTCNDFDSLVDLGSPPPIFFVKTKVGAAPTFLILASTTISSINEINSLQ